MSPVNPVKCPICNKLVDEAGINAHLDSNCQFNIVMEDGTIKNVLNDRDSSITSNGDVKITSKFQKTTPNHIYLGANSVEKKKTVQSTLFGNLSNKRKSTDDILNKKIPNHSLSNFKSTYGVSNNSSNSPNKSHSIINNNSSNSNNNSSRINNMNKKIKIEDTSSPTHFDINRKYDNNYDNNKNIGKRDIRKQLPLAELVRPKTLDDYFGQEEIMGKNSLLKTLILEYRIPSLILWGPPGVGKTCLARIISNHYKTFYKEISGTLHSLQDLKKASEDCANHFKLTGKKAILFIDEIHRFNKLQQDSLLTWVERGAFLLIGATTENPSFKLNSALLSRCRVFQLKKLSKNAMMSILQRAAKMKLELYDKTLVIEENSDSTDFSNNNNNNNNNESNNYNNNKENDNENNNIGNDNDSTKNENENSNSLNEFKSSKDTYEKKNNVYIEREVLELIAIMSDGDARNCLNILDMALDLVLTDDSKNRVTKEMIKMSFQKTHLLYDKNGEEHYDLISAFHKSIRGSDENATLYWLGRMIYAGEDPLYIARRLIRIASEDVGFGDNYALTLATSCYQACQFIGMPECDVILAHTAVYMSRAKKSVEVYKALSMVKNVIQQEIAYPVPMHIRNAPTMLMEKLGYGKGYKYNPDYEEPVEQEYLPKDLKCRRYLGVFEENRRKAYLEKLGKERKERENNNNDIIEIDTNTDTDGHTTDDQKEQ